MTILPIEEVIYHLGFINGSSYQCPYFLFVRNTIQKFFVLSFSLNAVIYCTSDRRNFNCLIL